jgi:hypothetical protein
MVLVAINKTDHAITADVQLKDGKPFRTAEVYQLIGNDPSPVRAGQMPVIDPGHFTYTMPAYSVSTINLIAP